MNFDEEINRPEEQEPPKASASQWMISMIDLMSLIFSFFVMMYATKDLPPEKMETIRKSFTKYVYGSKPEQQYNFIEKQRGEIKIIKKAANMNYVETLFRNSMRDSPDIQVSAQPNSVKVEFEENYKNTKNLFNKLSILSKTLNAISNQVEVSAQSGDINSSLTASEIVSAKLEEFGYEYKILRTLPDEVLTENIEKNKNRVKISIIVNSYESVF